MSNKFIVIVPVYNSSCYIAKCLDSIVYQDFKDYTITIVDDSSSDKTFDIALSYSCDNRIKFIRNKHHVGSPLYSTVEAIKNSSIDKDDIIVTVDGDDYLYDNNVLKYLDEIYKNNDVWMTYGQYIPLSNEYKDLCRQLEDARNYRKSAAWFVSHLRTFKKKLWDMIEDKDLRSPDGEYFKVAGDAAYLYPMIEMCGLKRMKFIDKILYVYNDLNSSNEMKIYLQEQRDTAQYIRNKEEYKECI